MIQVSEEVLKQMVDAIVREVDPERIVLFGSRARGEAREGSDFDLLIVEREPFGPTRSRFAEASRIWDLAARLRFPADVLLYSTDELERWRHSRNHLIATALAEGNQLYERR